MLFLRWFAICLLCLPLTLFAADKPVTKDDLDHAKEVIQLKLDAAQSGLQKDSQSQDKRIDDIKSSVDWFIGGLSLIVIFLGVASYVSATSKAKQEAQTAVADWFKDYREKLDNALTDFQNKSQKLLEDIEHQARLARENVAQQANRSMQSMIETAENVSVRAKAHMTTMQTAMQMSTTNLENPSLQVNDDEGKAALKQAANTLQQQPEASYGFDEWDTRAFAAYDNGDLEGAVRYWKQAAESKNATAIQTAQSLVNSSVALREQKLFGATIDICNDVIARFGNDLDPALREYVAKALFNKGNALRQKHCDEEALSAYNDVIVRFGDDTIPTLREQVASAMNNMGGTLIQLQRYEEAIVIYDKSIARFNNDPAPFLHNLFAYAQNGKGFALLRLAKQNWHKELSRNEWLQEAQQLFAQALEHNSEKGIVLGNQAYCAHLLGQTEQVPELLRQALTAGGEKLYLDTRGDLAIHPVPPDAEFRKLLDEVWAEVQKSQ